MIIRLIRQWRVSQALDRAADPPPRPSFPPTGHDRLVMVHEALRRSTPGWSDPAPGARERTLEAVRRASRGRAAPAHRPFSSLHLVMAGILAVCALVGVYAMLAPPASTRPGSPIARGPLPAPGGEEAEPGNLLGGLRLAGLWHDITAPLKRVTEEAIQTPARNEGENLVADFRRGTNFLLTRQIPLLGNQGSDQ
ncbi:MAG: hypothetical protein IT437_04320 [Phycisphaerales bacterium]|nr:hypothetical protein [Phycisphaerales bacterium]